MKIIALVGSIRRSSYNRKLATFVQKRYADQLDVTIPNLGALPFYDQDIELEAPRRCKPLSRRSWTRMASFL
ncbi:hypothetical protein TUA1478L_15940 [Lactiplantibacillus plantarum]|nr:NAD(P)H-dependent oxidoreductase [Lactiplantibacillus plantarum]